MGLAKLTVTLSTTVRVHHCGVYVWVRVHETAMTVVQAMVYGSEVGVWAPRVWPCAGAVVPDPPCVYFARPSLPGGALSCAPNSRPLEDSGLRSRLYLCEGVSQRRVSVTAVPVAPPPPAYSSARRCCLKVLSLQCLCRLF